MQSIPLILALGILILLAIYGIRLFILPVWYRHCAIVCLKRGDSEMALEMFNRLIHFLPQNGNAWFCRALLNRELGRSEEALEDFQHTIECIPNQAEPFLERARLLMDMERYEEALADLNQAVPRHPYPVEIILTRSAVQIQRGDYAKAEEDCNWVLRHDPAKAGAVYNRGMARYKMGHLEEALADYELAMLMSPSLTIATVQAISCHLEKGEFERVIKMCNRLLLREPEEGGAYYYRAQAKRELGQTVEAEEDERLATEKGFQPDEKPF